MALIVVCWHCQRVIAQQPESRERAEWIARDHEDEHEEVMEHVEADYFAA